VVASAPNDEWFGNVEADLTGLFDHYAQLAQLPPDTVSSLVDLQLDHIYIDTPDSRATVARKSTSFSNDTSIQPHDSSSSSNKTENWNNPLEEGTSRKRKFSLVDSSSIPRKGAQMVHVPPFKFYVRPYQVRSLPSQHQQHQPTSFPVHHRISFSDSLPSPSSTSPHPQAIQFNHASFYSLESPSPSSITSATSTFRQQRAPAIRLLAEPQPFISLDRHINHLKPLMMIPAIKAADTTALVIYQSIQPIHHHSTLITIVVIPMKCHF
jgi:hypothetical protein